jgi:hypothetical protein
MSGVGFVVMQTRQLFWALFDGTLEKMIRLGKMCAGCDWWSLADAA